MARTHAKGIKARRSARADVKAAALEWKPWTLRDDELPSLEKFRHHMVNIRLAGAGLRLSKAELIETLRDLVGDKGDNGAPKAFISSLERSAAVLRELAKMCDAMRARIHVAACAAEIEDKQRTRRRGGGRSEPRSHLAR